MIYPFTNIGGGQLVISATVNDTPIRNDGTAEDPDFVYSVEQIDIINTNGSQWYFTIRREGTLLFEAIVTPSTETHINLAPGERFETAELQVSVSSGL